MQHTMLLTLDREPTQISMQVQLGEPVSVTEVFIGAEMTQKISCITKAHPSMDDSSQTGYLNHTA